MVNFQSGYRQVLWNAKQISTVPQNASVDPTLMYPSTQGPIDQTAKCSGVFFKFNVSPTSFDLDPYFFFDKNDYSITARAGLTKDFNHKKFPVASGSHSVQPMVWKGPFYLSGWGYDVCGLPMPSGSNGRVFNLETPVDRSKWKTGPVDLRWDDNRKVWTGGTEIIEGRMVSNLSAGDFSSPSVGSGQIYRGKNLQYSTFTLVRNNSGVVKPNPYGEMVKDGPSSLNVKEIVQLTNRNNSFSLQSGDYFLAANINYEWRPIGGGAAGGGTVSSSGNNEFLMILGPYSQYSGCCNISKPPVTDAGCTEENFCANQYAWASYKVCGYKYYKVRTYCSYGAWASELNSELGECGSAGKFRFYPAIFAGSRGLPDDPTEECPAGVRFINYHGKGDRGCSCADLPPLDELKCIRIKQKFIPRPDFGENDENLPPGCEYLVKFMDEGGWWENETSWEDACLFAGGTCLFQGGLFNTNINIRQYGEEDKECFSGPNIFDPCNPCSGFLKVEAGINANDKIAGCGGFTYGNMNVSIQDIIDIATGCPVKEYQPTISCQSCGINVFDKIYLSCCDNNRLGSCG
jgi:hypothetical protein